MKDTKQKKIIAERIFENFSKNQILDEYFEYINGCNKSIIAKICSGNIALPSIRFYEHLRHHEVDEQILEILNKNIELTKEFYESAFALAYENSDDFRKFSSEFESKIQPIGNSILLNLELLRLLNNHKNFERGDGEFLLKIIYEIKYNTVMFAHNHKINYKYLYMMASLVSVPILTSLSYFISGGITNFFASILSSSACAAFATIFLYINYDDNSFENSGIDGVNNLAILYRTLFSKALSEYEKGKLLEKSRSLTISAVVKTNREDKILDFA